MAPRGVLLMIVLKTSLVMVMTLFVQRRRQVKIALKMAVAARVSGGSVKKLNLEEKNPLSFSPHKITVFNFDGFLIII